MMPFIFWEKYLEKLRMMNCWVIFLVNFVLENKYRFQGGLFIKKVFHLEMFFLIVPTL